MKTASYAFALGAALLLTGSVGASAQEGLFTSERDCAVDVKSLCAGISPGGAAFLRAYRRTSGATLRGLFDNSVEGRLDRQGMRRGHSAILPQRHIRQHFRLHETASRRGQRQLQVSAGVHGLSRRRSVLRTSMRKSVSIGATVIGAALLATLPISVKWSAEENLSVSVDGSVGWLSARSQQPI